MNLSPREPHSRRLSRRLARRAPIKIKDNTRSEDLFLTLPRAVIDVHYVLACSGGCLPRFSATIRNSLFVWAEQLSLEPRNTSIRLSKRIKLLAQSIHNWVNLAAKVSKMDMEIVDSEQAINNKSNNSRHLMLREWLIHAADQSGNLFVAIPNLQCLSQAWASLSRVHSDNYLLSTHGSRTSCILRNSQYCPLGISIHQNVMSNDGNYPPKIVHGLVPSSTRQLKQDQAQPTPCAFSCG